MEKSKKHLRILFTDVGHPITGSTLMELRKQNENFHFVGVDNTDETGGFLWVDKFYVISKPFEDNYVQDLLNVCIKEKIQLIIPWTNEEALIIARNHDLFEKNHIKLLNNTVDKIEALVDKGRMFENLKKKGFVVPNFRLASNINDIEKTVIELGYPQKPVVVKPRSLSGERGFCIIDKKVNLDIRGFGNRLPLKAFLSLLEESNNKRNLNYVVMDFLAGKDFSVDCLCKNGKPIFIIPRTRGNAMGGVSLMGETTNDPNVRKQAEKVIKDFNLSFNVNIQFKYRDLNNTQPFIYDINPRISGTIVANSGAGVDLLYYGIKLALNEPVITKKKIKYHGVKMIRYWEQKFIETGKKFDF
jgi:carbamoyl-phosphate synthase large subunit